MQKNLRKFIKEGGLLILHNCMNLVFKELLKSFDSQDDIQVDVDLNEAMVEDEEEEKNPFETGLERTIAARRKSMK